VANAASIAHLSILKGFATTDHCCQEEGWGWPCKQQGNDNLLQKEYNFSFSFRSNTNINHISEQKQSHR
jgi:hypothetical protein